MNIFLVGYRCTGKTTAGKALSTKLGLEFRDTDQIISAETGMDIAEFIVNWGWDAFRKKEKQVVSRLCLMDGRVIATGGGAVMDPENLTVMRASGTVIWLRAPPATIQRRMQYDDRTSASRPSLTGQGSLEEINTVLRERDAVYARAAHHSLDTDALSIEQVIEKIIVLAANNFETG